jgi:surface protein
MPISKLSVNTMLGSCKYDHKRPFIFTGSNTTKQNTANNNRIKARAVEKPCGCPNESERVSYVFNTKNELTIAIDLWITKKSVALVTYGEINTWDVSQITNMSNLFIDNTGFNDNISNWNVSNVDNMRYMFSNAQAFNQDIGNWDVSSVTTMRYMFSNAQAFNQSLDNWNTSSVTDMGGMFSGAIAFNQLVYSWEWNVDSVSNDSAGAGSFNNMFNNTNMPSGTPSTPNKYYFNFAS